MKPDFRMQPVIKLDAVLDIVRWGGKITAANKPEQEKARFQLALFLERINNSSGTLIKYTDTDVASAEKGPAYTIKFDALETAWLEYKRARSVKEDALNSREIVRSYHAHSQLVKAMTLDLEIFAAQDRDNPYRLPDLESLRGKSYRHLEQFIARMQKQRDSGMPISARDRDMVVFVAEKLTPMLTPKTVALKNTPKDHDKGMPFG